MSDNEEVPILAHHKQQPLCTSRQSYRQGRKLTAVKVYTINDESKHLLVFGVPALNLRRETKALFAKFGKILQFTLTKHPAEDFTETYHAVFERIHSARLAKKMVDTKNYYGGILHICYAPEYETVKETKDKLTQRRKDVLYRLHNLNKEHNKKNNEEKDLTIVSLDNDKGGKEIVNECETSNKQNESTDSDSINDLNITKLEVPRKLNMGEVNVISMGPCRKRKIVPQNRFKPTFSDDKDIEILDCTDVEKSVVTNINDTLNYNKFGNEVIRKVPKKKTNKISFKVENKHI